MPRVQKKCPHNRQKYQCRECGECAGICEHGRQRSVSTTAEEAHANAVAAHHLRAHVHQVQLRGLCCSGRKRTMNLSSGGQERRMPTVLRGGIMPADDAHSMLGRQKEASASTRQTKNREPVETRGSKGRLLAPSCDKMEQTVR